MKGVSIALKRIGEFTDHVFKDTAKCLPESTIVGLADGGDITSTIRCTIEEAGNGVKLGLDTAADVVDIAENAVEAAKEDVGLQSAIELDVQDARLDLYNQTGDINGLIRQEPGVRAEVYAKVEAVRQAIAKYRTDLAGGQRLLSQLITFRKNTAASVQQYRYQDMAFRIFRNDALQKYRAQFDLAARYAYLAATAYDYETNLLGSNTAPARTS